jgi:hypothetical protein
MTDRDKTRINAYGNTRPGNPLENDKELQQILTPIEGRYRSSVELYAGLSHRDKTLLKPKAILPTCSRRMGNQSTFDETA